MSALSSPRRRRRLVWLGAVVAVFALAAGVIALIPRHDGSSARTFNRTQPGNPFGATTTLNAISIGGFGGAGASMDVGYIMDLSSALAPSTADRSPGPGSGVITFDFAGGIPTGSDVKTLVVRTDLTNWDGLAGIGFNVNETFPGHDPVRVSGIAQIATPEPSSILLLGTGALLALRLKKRT